MSSEISGVIHFDLIPPKEEASSPAERGQIKLPNGKTYQIRKDDKIVKDLEEILFIDELITKIIGSNKELSAAVSDVTLTHLTLVPPKLADEVQRTWSAQFEEGAGVEEGARAPLISVQEDYFPKPQRKIAQGLSRVAASIESEQKGKAGGRLLTRVGKSAILESRRALGAQLRESVNPQKLLKAPSLDRLLSKGKARLVSGAAKENLKTNLSTILSGLNPQRIGIRLLRSVGHILKSQSKPGAPLELSDPAGKKIEIGDREKAEKYKAEALSRIGENIGKLLSGKSGEGEKRRLKIDTFSQGNLARSLAPSQIKEKLAAIAEKRKALAAKGPAEPRDPQVRIDELVGMINGLLPEEFQKLGITTFARNFLEINKENPNIKKFLQGPEKESDVSKFLTENFEVFAIYILDNLTSEMVDVCDGVPSSDSLSFDQTLSATLNIALTGAAQRAGFRGELFESDRKEEAQARTPVDKALEAAVEFSRPSFVLDEVAEQWKSWVKGVPEDRSAFEEERKRDLEEDRKMGRSLEEAGQSIQGAIAQEFQRAVGEQATPAKIIPESPSMDAHISKDAILRMIPKRSVTNLKSNLQEILKGPHPTRLGACVLTDIGQVLSLYQAKKADPKSGLRLQTSAGESIDIQSAASVEAYKKSAFARIRENAGKLLSEKNKAGKLEIAGMSSANLVKGLASIFLPKKIQKAAAEAQRPQDESAEAVIKELVDYISKLAGGGDIINILRSFLLANKDQPEVKEILAIIGEESELTKFIKDNLEMVIILILDNLTGELVSICEGRESPFEGSPDPLKEKLTEALDLVVAIKSESALSHGELRPPVLAAIEQAVEFVGPSAIVQEVASSWSSWIGE